MKGNSFHGPGRGRCVLRCTPINEADGFIRTAKLDSNFVRNFTAQVPGRQPFGSGAIPARAHFSPAVCFALGLLILMPIAPESRLTAFDLVAPALLLSQWRVAMGGFKGILLLLAVSVSAMFASAEINASGLVAFVGRSYPMVALTIEMIAYYVIFRGSDLRGCASLVLGTMIGICFHYFYPNDLRILDDPIKFLIGIPLGVGLLALPTVIAPRSTSVVPLAVAFMLGYALFCFVMGSRSIGGVYVVSALLLITLRYVRIPRGYAQYAPLMILLSVAGTYALTELYTYLALRGVFGDRAAGIAYFQSSFGSILLGGRPEIIVNIMGAQDSPFWGVGILNYPSIYVYEMINLAVYSQNEVLQLDNILYHSALFATAFESGVIAAAFWGMLAYRTVFIVPLLCRLTPNVRTFIGPLAIITVWHILYSPPIPYNRFIMAIGLALVFFVYSQWKESTPRPRQTR